MHQYNCCVTLPLLVPVQVRKPAPHLQKASQEKGDVHHQGFRHWYQLHHPKCSTLDFILFHFVFKRVLYKLQVPKILPV